MYLIFIWNELNHDPPETTNIITKSCFNSILLALSHERIWNDKVLTLNIVLW